MHNTVLSPMALMVVIGISMMIGSWIPIVVNGIWDIIRAKRITARCRKLERESRERVAAMLQKEGE